MISASPIEEIKARLDIAEVVGEYVPLKQAGPERLRARCPFHSERTPSFMVSRDRQIFHCFGCGEGGDVISFVQKMEGLEFPDALRLLAKKANVELPSYDPKLQSERASILEALRLAGSFFHEYLLHAKAAEPARKYLMETRGLTSDTLEQFQLGYAPDAWDGLLGALRKRKISDAHIVAAGLAVRREKGTGMYDRFRHRIMFPIRDAHGTTIGFGGRAMDSNEPAKYINTPQTMVYNKSAVLYGLDQAKAAIRQEKVAVVVEGYMDCIASHQAGVKHVVASSGTALTDGQVHLLKRFAPAVALSFDMDPAGETAAKRGVAVAWREGLDVQVVSLPFGKDPDECIRKDPKAWAEAIAQRQPILDFYFSRTLNPRDPTKVEDKKAAAKILLPVLAMVADPIEQTHYLQKLGQWLQVEEQILRRKLVSSTPGQRVTQAIATPAPVMDRTERICQQILGLLQLEPDAIPGIAKDLPAEAFPPGVWRDLYKFFLNQYSSEHNPSPATWAQAAGERDASLADALAVANLAVTSFTRASSVERHREIEAAVRALLRVWLDQEMAKITPAMQAAEARHDTAVMQELSAQFTALTQQLRRL